MYGLVNAAVKEFVTSNFGHETWDKIRIKAGVSVTQFDRMEQYPDELTYKLVGAATEVLDIPAAQALHGFGEFWVLYTGREGYGEVFQLAGSSLKEFINNLDTMHARIGQSFPRLKPPSFQVEVIDEDQVRMHYRPGAPSRPGLCPMVAGLLSGLSKHFKTELQVEHDVCSQKGAEHCEFLLTFPPA